MIKKEGKMCFIEKTLFLLSKLCNKATKDQKQVLKIGPIEKGIIRVRLVSLCMNLIYFERQNSKATSLTTNLQIAPCKEGYFWGMHSTTVS